MRQKLLAMALCLCLVITLLPTMALAADPMHYDSWADATAAGVKLAEGDTVTIDETEYTYQEDGSSGFYAYQTVNSCFKAGNGYALLIPASGTDGAKLTLHNAIIDGGSSGDAAIVVPKNTTVYLEGKNSITSTKRGIFARDEAYPYTSGALTVTGGAESSLSTSGSTGLQGSSVTIENTTVNVSYPNGTSGINSGAGDITIENSTVTVKSDGSSTAKIGSGAIFANDNQGVNGSNSDVYITNSKVIAIDTTGKAIDAAFGEVKLKDSDVVAIGKDDSFGAVNYSKPIVVDGGRLYAENTGRGYDIAYVSGNSSLNSAVVYYNSNLNYIIQVGSNIQYGNCTYNKTTGEITVGAGYSGRTYVYGAVTWSDDMIAPPSGTVYLVAGASMTIPEGTTTLDSCFLRISSGAELILNGDLNTTKGLMLYGTKSGSGTVNAVVLPLGKKVGDVVTYTYTASGNAVYNASFVDLGAVSTTENDILTVPTGATLTVPSGVTLDATVNGITAANLDSYFYVDGAVNNQGVILLPEGTTVAAIKALKLTGDGLVKIGENTYTNDGALYRTTGLDFTSESGYKADATVDTDGYSYASDGKGGYTLTLGNLYMDVADTVSVINLPSNANVNIVLTGKTILKGIRPAICSDLNGVSCTVTISGNGTLDAVSTQSAAIMLCGSEQKLEISGGTINANGYTAAIYAKAGITLAGTEIKSPTGTTIGEYNSYISILKSEGSAATSVTIGAKPVPSGPSNTTTTVTNPDGSTTTTVTDTATGTATITDKATNGVTTVTKTDKDGAATETTVTVPDTVKDPVKVDVPTDLGKADGTVSAVVTYPDGKKETVTGSYSGGKVSVTVNGTANIEILDDFVPLASALPFEDVPTNAWYYKELVYAYENGLFAGTSDTSFSPKAPMTRQQMWMVLARMAGENPADMDAARKWAMENKVSDGTNSANDVTREQFVTLLWRFAGSPKATKDMSGYSDFDSVSDYAKEAMRWAVENGIVSGTTPTTLNPTGNAIREQVAAILARYAQK